MATQSACVGLGSKPLLPVLSEKVSAVKEALYRQAFPVLVRVCGWWTSCKLPAEPCCVCVLSCALNLPWCVFCAIRCASSLFHPPYLLLLYWQALARRSSTCTAAAAPAYVPWTSLQPAETGWCG